MSRGRGKAPRGRGFGSQLEALGITSAGDSAPPPILQPPPLFPPLDRKPLELQKTDVDRYLLQIKQELRTFMRESGFYVVDDSGDLNNIGKKAKVEIGVKEWAPDNWSYYPKELEIRKTKRKKNKTGVVKTKTTVTTPARNTKLAVLDSVFDENEIFKVPLSPSKSSTVDQSLTEGAVKPGTAEEGEDKAEKEEEDKGSEEEGTEEEFYDEEIEEEGTDYNLTYFDPGEDYLGEDDDGGDEGPYY